jgi:autotransporter-associated beta strand protein
MQNRNNKRMAVLCGAVATIAGLYGVSVPMAHAAATTGFNQTGTGPWDYNNTANWVGGTINGTWDSSLTLAAAQTVQFAADTTLTTGLTFNYGGAFGLTLDSSSSTAHTMTLGGDIAVNPASNQTVTIGNATNALNVNLGGATRTFTVNPSKTLTFTNVISGTNPTDGITATGGGTVILNGNANTFTGVLSVTGGSTLNLVPGNNAAMNGGAPSALGAASSAASNIVLDNGTLAFGSVNPNTNRLFTIGLGGATVVGQQGNFNNTGALGFSGTGAHVLNLKNTISSGFIFSPQITDAGSGQPTSVVVTGATNSSETNLLGANTYTGGTTITGGVLAATNGNSALGTGSVTVNGGGALEITATTNLNTAGGASVLLNGSPTNYAMFAVGFDATQSFLNAAISSSSTNGILSLYDSVNSGTHAGQTTQALDMATLGDGKLFLSGAGTSTGNNFAQTVAYTASTLGVGADNTYRLGGGQSNGARSLIITHDVLANIGGNSLQNNLVIAPPGMNSSAQTVQFLSANSAFAGTTTINSGTLLLSNAGALGGSDITANANPSGAVSPTTISFDSSTAGVAGTTRAKSVTLNGANLLVTGNSTANSVDTMTNALTISAGASNGGAPGVDVITVIPNAAKNAQLAAGSLAPANGGVALFRGANLGVNTIASQTANNSNIQFTTAPTLVGGGGAAGSTNISIIPFALGGTTTADTGSTFVTYDATNGIRPLNTSTEYNTSTTPGSWASTDNVRPSGTAALTGNTTVNSMYLNAVSLTGTSTLTITSGALSASNTTAISDNIDFGSAHGYIGKKDGTGFNFSLNGNITGSNGVTVYNAAGGPQGGAHTVAFNGNNTYTGDTTIIGGLTAANVNAIPNGPGKGNVIVYGSLDSRAGTAEMNGLSGGGFLTNSSFAGGGFIIGNNDATSEFDGVITSPLNITKIGSGALTLTGNNTYSLLTTVSAGTLVAANTTAGQSSTGTGNVILNAGTLASAVGATSYVAGTVIAGSGAHTIAPGNVGSIGQLNVGGLTLNANSTLSFDISSLSHDLLQDTGSLTIASGTPTVSLTTSGTLSGNYTLATYSGSGLSNSSFTLPTAPAGYAWNVNNSTLELDATASHSASFAFSTSTPAGSAMVGTENPPGTTGSVITLTGAGGGNYNPGYLNNVTANGNNGYVQIDGFSNGDNQIAALSITVNGSAPTAAQLAEILSDLGANAEAFATNSAGGSFAAALQTSNPGAYNALMAGDVNFATDPFQIALLNPAGLTPGSPAFLAMDFSNEIDAGNSISNVVVTNIAAIPEPGSLALVGLVAAAGMLGQRRRRSLS